MHDAVIDLVYSVENMPHERIPTIVHVHHVLYYI